MADSEPATTSTAIATPADHEAAGDVVVCDQGKDTFFFFFFFRCESRRGPMALAVCAVPMMVL